jgi:prepilin-type processing-associated H-X9-DG protein
MRHLPNKAVAFTLLELAVVLAVAALLVVMVLPVLARDRGRDQQVVCANNLRQIGLAFKTWAVDHNNRFPMFVSSDQGGPPDQTSYTTSVTQFGAAYLCEVFGVMSNELVTPKLLVCPADERTAYSNFYTVTQFSSGKPLTDNCVSYFLGKDANESLPQMLLAGDRNIYGNNVNTAAASSYSGFSSGYGNPNQSSQNMGLPSAAATAPCWTAAKMHQFQGNILFADGHCQEATSARLRAALDVSGDTKHSLTSPGTNTFLFP